LGFVGAAKRVLADEAGEVDMLEKISDPFME
jgi:hypothetical protein